MIRVIHQSYRKARKNHYCDLREHVYNLLWPSGKLSFSELRVLAKYKQNHGRIVKGDIYVRQFNEYEGQTYVWIAHKDIFDLLLKYNLFPEYD